MKTRWRPSMFIMLLSAFVMIPRIPAKLIGAVVMPHGDFALDPSLVKYANGSLEVHIACINAAGFLRNLKPDHILLSTPHGLELTRDFALYINSAATGFANIGEDLHDPKVKPYKVSVSTTMDAELASTLITSLSPLNITGLLSFANSEPTSLRWGEVVPLYFLRQWLDETQVVILSQPYRRYSESIAMIPELLELGGQLYDLLDALEERVAVVISSDLAHTHQADGPYGYSEAAGPFDEACGRWASTLDESALLHDAASLADEAKSCGFTGLVMLQGILRRSSSSSSGHQQWTSKLLANAHPTYYGLMVATFEPQLPPDALLPPSLILQDESGSSDDAVS